MGEGDVDAIDHARIARDRGSLRHLPNAQVTDRAARLGGDERRRSPAHDGKRQGETAVGLSLEWIWMCREA